MPALRKSRTSRTTTPYAAGGNTPPRQDSRKEKAQKSLDAWIEPPPKNPTPSFEDHGFARHGVLETMAPLGVLPSAKVKQRTRVMGEPAPRRMGLGKNGSMFAGEDGVSTPETTPAPELDREDSEKHDDDDEIRVASYRPPEEDEDDDYVPSKSKAKHHNTKTTPVRGKTPVGGKTPVNARTPVKNGVSKNSTPLRSPATQGALPQPSSIARQRIQIAVNDAMQRANVNLRQNVGFAIRQLHEAALTDPYYADVLEAIIHQNPTPEQFAAFRQFIKNAKKRIKREARMREKEDSLFNAASTSTTKAVEDASPSKKAAASHNTEPATPPDQPLSPNDVIIVDVPEVTATKDTNQGIAHPLDTAPTLPATHSPSPPSHMPSKSTQKQQGPEAAKSQGLEVDVENEVSSKAPTPAAKSSPSAIEGSDSDLSDVNEEIVQNGPPEPVQQNGNNVPPMSKKARSAAIARTGKKFRANSAKPNGRFEKKPLPSAKDIAEDLELQAKRQAMAEQQLSRTEFNPPLSDMRFEDEMLETESLTESQIAVGPPIDSHRPKRASRPLRNGGDLTIHLYAGGKRVREDNSALLSPQPDSAATTRPTTPAIVPPGPKRLKLNNGQAARTKRSPVKNRDGPIAGIPHVGGGGLRPLGPDDNAQGSPPSESDDWCAACKGAGEFVCCEGCPRVFHFLCLDPPRDDAPEGSFLCYECTVRFKASEEHVSRAFTPLGPLFKQLESTNTRAFALPPNIQNYFENVEAKPDGSYFEKTRKFPLAKSSGYGYQKPDYLKTADNNHKTVLCAQCGSSSGGKRPMIQCDFCHAYWHLDCCDPPLANTPPVSLEATHRDAWRCPRHIDHDLRSGLLFQNDLNELGRDDVEMNDAAPAPRLARRVRKPKKASVVEPIISRGTPNNGLIDIINDSDDETDGEGNYVFPRNTLELDESKDQNSKVFRIPEKGIILDFLTKVKQDRIEKQKKSRRDAKAAQKAAVKRKSTMEHFAARSIQQQQTALHLMQLAHREQDIGLNETNVDALILSLTVRHTLMPHNPS
ncbi:hypothetical protein CC78DRAFT_529903 [Lojkania enalia]|uniref:PHD-type domain-containing protein n=1 Tax=Lojkania enalia TaxID=147567 RepID=A0A9P4N747_9PLEO|nr:hypothetical protein CC78DRAFT_529903 [Didymosphaeria enalia]